MLKEFFESVVNQAHKSVAPEQPTVFMPLTSNDGREVSYVYNGEIVSVTVPANPRDHVASSAADLVAMVAAFGEAFGCPPDSQEASDSKEASTVRRLSTATLFINPAGVTAIIDDARRETITLPLTRSGHFELLKSFPKSFNQRDAIALLRRGFAGTGLENYATNLRQVVFERQTVGAGVSQRNTESMGRSIEKKVTGTADLPEFLTGEMSVYSPAVFHSPWRFEVGCDPRLEDEMFDFWLPPDALALGLLRAELQLAEYLRDQLPGAVVVRGTP